VIAESPDDSGTRAMIERAGAALMAGSSSNGGTI
jgi:hypothetical protein